MDKERANQTLDRHQWIIKAQAGELSHSDSLLQLPFRGNCFNWILGHVLVHRDIMLELLGESTLLGPKEHKLYGIESEPLTTEDDAVDFDQLLETARLSARELRDAISNASEDLFSSIFNEERGMTIQDRVEFLIWHETYHLGQLEILRQLAGKNDAVI